jgi:deoxyribodipyrimidine photo-lyase
MLLQIVWFKRDLRLEDHAPLHAAAARGPVLPLYVIEPALWREPDVSSRHWQFTRDSLLDLDTQLRELGGALHVVTGDIPDVFISLLNQQGPFELWSHEETGNGWTFARDLRLAAWCRAEGIGWHELPANGVVRRLKSRDLWSTERDRVMRQSKRPVPKQIRFGSPTLRGADLTTDATPLPSLDDPMFGASTPRVQTGGRRAGLKVLESFLEDRSRYYMRTISKPGVSARHCSRLSAHIAYGTLSVREIVQATEQRIGELEARHDPASDAWAGQLAAFASRLAWRCHFVQKLEQQPAIETHCMHPAFEGMRENDFRADFFDAWCGGQTGYPLIDACMRSLHANGWITFRMRAMLVAFASYHLWLDWRRTAPFMAKLFTDYEPGIHYSQFQMQSGVTGINAVRIYNPVKQSYDHGPEGRFIRRYLPELRDVPAEFIHEPWLLDQPPRDYPPPIVEHEAAARLARQRMSAYRHGEDFRAQATEVHRKLGSRSKSAGRNKSGAQRSRKPKPVDPQIGFAFED